MARRAVREGVDTELFRVDPRSERIHSGAPRVSSSGPAPRRRAHSAQFEVRRCARVAKADKVQAHGFTSAEPLSLPMAADEARACTQEKAMNTTLPPKPTSRAGTC
jgi:hypothetical protein